MESTASETPVEHSTDRDTLEEVKKKEEAASEAERGKEVEGHEKENTDEEKPESQASKDEKDGWVYILGHDKLKKKVSSFE